MKTSRTANANRGVTPGSTRPGRPDAPAIGRGNADIVAPREEKSVIFAEYPDLLTTDHVAAILGVCRTTVQSLCRKGELPNVKVGNRVYIPKTRLIRKLVLNGADEGGAR